MIKAMEPEIKKALPQVITPERFSRMALSALNTTPKLAECSQMSFLGALMNAAQLGLEPNIEDDCGGRSGITGLSEQLI